MDELPYNVHETGYNSTRNDAYEVYGGKDGDHTSAPYLRTLKAHEMATCGGNHHGDNTA